MAETTLTVKYEMAGASGVVKTQPYKATAKFAELSTWKYTDKLNNLTRFSFSVPNDEHHRANALFERKVFIPFLKPFNGVVTGRARTSSKIMLDCDEFAFHLTRRIFKHDSEDTIKYTNSMWYDSSWKYRRKLIITKTNVKDDIKAYPLLVNLGTDTSFKNRAQADGDDFLFTTKDGVTKIPHEIEKYDSSTGELVVWVKVDKVDDGSNTEIYVYYGNSGASNQEDIVNVWKEAYRVEKSDVISTWAYAMVQHLHSDAIDSTENNNDDGSPYMVTYSNAVIAKGASFDGVDSQINVASDTSIDDIFASEGWVTVYINPDSDGEGNEGYILDKSKWRLQVRNEVSNSIDIRFFRDFNTTDGIWDYTISNGLNAAIRIDIIYDETNVANDPVFYINGVAVTPTETQTPVGTAVSDASDSLYIGNSSGKTNTFDGDIDEVRLMKTPPPDYIHIIPTEYANHNNPTDFVRKLQAEQYQRPANEVAQQILDYANTDMPSNVTWTLDDDFPTTDITLTINRRTNFQALHLIGEVLGKDVWFDNDKYIVKCGVKGKTLDEELDIVITTQSSESTDHFANIIDVIGEKDDVGVPVAATSTTSTVLRNNYEKIVSDSSITTQNQATNIAANLLTEFQAITPQIEGEIPYSQFVRLNLEAGDTVLISQPIKELNGRFRIMELSVAPEKVRLILEGEDTATIRTRSASLSDIIEGLIRQLQQT